MDQKEDNKRGRDQEIPISISEESVLSLAESEEDLHKLQQELKEKILLEAERDLPDLEDDDEVLNGMMAQVLLKLSKEEQILYLDHQPRKMGKKVEDILNEDLENCALLISRLSTHIKKQAECKELVDQKRKMLKYIVQNIENLKVENSEEDLRNILQKVNQKFNFLRNKLSDLIEEWDGDNATEITEILSELTRANLENTGPTSEGKYVEVKNFRREVVQFLVSSRVVVWDKDEELIKLSM